MFAIIVGCLFGINVAIAVSCPNPITIGCSVVSGCMFLVCLLN